MVLKKNGKRTTVTLPLSEFRSWSTAQARRMRNAEIVVTDASGKPTLVISRQRVAIEA